MIDAPANGTGTGTGDAIEVHAQGEHEYVVRLSTGADVVESWFRLTPDVLDRLGTSEVGEEELVRRTVAFLLHYQDAADFPAVVELEDVLAAYDGYAAAMTS